MKLKFAKRERKTKVTNKAVGLIGDPHGMWEELEDQIEWLHSQGIPYENIWILGDFLDRGPDSGKAVRAARLRGCRAVKGNHEWSIINRWSRFHDIKNTLRPNEDKDRTIRSLTQEDIDWLDALPKLHVIDDLQLVLVHGGLYPGLPFHLQPHNVIRLQLINKAFPDASKWWGPKTVEKYGFTEAEMNKQGWHRWYELHDSKFDVAFGHSVFPAPMLHKNLNSGTCFGIDQGGCFGGYLTAMIHDGQNNFQFRTLRAKKLYCTDMFRQFGDPENE